VRIDNHDDPVVAASGAAERNEVLLGERIHERGVRSQPACSRVGLDGLDPRPGPALE